MSMALRTGAHVASLSPPDRYLTLDIADEAGHGSARAAGPGSGTPSMKGSMSRKMVKLNLL